MRICCLLLAVNILLAQNLWGQKRILFFENVSLEVDIINNGDSLAADIVVTNHGTDTVYVPFLTSINSPKYEISFIAGEFGIRVEHNSKFAGLSLELSQVLSELKPTESFRFRTGFVERSKMYKFVMSLDFITRQDLRNLPHSTFSPNLYLRVKDSDYV